MEDKIRDKRMGGWFYVDNELIDYIGRLTGPIGISVYMSLCRHADVEQCCFPSEELIGKEIGVTEKSVRNYLKKLTELRLVSIDKKRNQMGRWMRNIYNLLDKDCWRLPSEPQSFESHRKVGLSPTESHINDQGNSVPIKETNNIKKTNSNDTQGIDFNIEEVFSFFREKINPTGRLLGDGRKKIKARLKTFSVQELKNAILKFAFNKWRMDNNSHFGPAWFFGSDDRIDQFSHLKEDRKILTDKYSQLYENSSKNIS